MIYNDRLKQFRESFIEKLEQKQKVVALSFYNRCTDESFDLEKEIKDLRLTKEALSISLSILNEEVTGHEEELS